MDNPKQHQSESPLLMDPERQLLLVEWNKTTTDYPKNQCLHQLFEAQVERTPDAVAVVLKEQHLTYRELNARANQLAHYLQALGVGPEVPVGICMERSLEMIVGLLSVLKAGGAYVPLDPSYPQERLAFMMQDSQVTVLLTQERLRVWMPRHTAQVVSLDADWEVIAQESKANQVSGVTAENLAYVIYTSGSTGRPKGVLITHRAVVNDSLAFKEHFDLQAKDRILQFASISFDVAAEEIFPSLLSGASIVLRPDQVTDFFYFSHFLEKERLTILNLPTSYWHLWVSQLSQSTALIPSSIRLVVVGGEKASPERFALWRKRVGNSVRWANAYGPTEATITATIYEPPTINRGATIDGEDLETCTIPIGRPIANVQVYVLDRFLQPVPIGEPGELHIGGAGLARGYLNHPELTAERFIPHPFSTDPHARLYKTGDLARYLPNGSIEFLGRIDDQVKIRGFRIEPGEIEAMLGRHPAVWEAVVVAREDTAGDKRLVAYVILHEGRTTTVADLQAHVLKELPDHMMPSAFVLLNSLPLTPNGKVDRHALPAPDPIRRTMEESFVAPTSRAHHQLAQIWEDLLDVRPIGIRDNFFYLGGHSLLAVRLVGRIEQVFGKKIPLATLFAAPTIEQLAHALQFEEGRHSPAPVMAVQTSGSKRPFFYLHGAWNSVAFYCFYLARHLGPDQPLYALEPYHFDGLLVAPTVEAMATAHIQSLRTIQPEGPYLLGGFCNGGLVAYEMARQLQAEGQRVELLLLIDPAYPPVLHAVVQSVISRVGNLLQLGPDKQLDCFLRLRHVYKYLRHERRLEDLKEFRAIDPSIQTLIPTAEALRQDNHAIFDWIIADYSYDLYPGKIILVWAREEPFRGVWRRKAAQEKDIELHVIPGTHIGCRTDHVQALAEKLRSCLSKVQADYADGELAQ